jgi:hypothetical protein
MNSSSETPNYFLQMLLSHTHSRNSKLIPKHIPHDKVLPLNYLEELLYDELQKSKKIINT